MTTLTGTQRIQFLDLENPVPLSVSPSRLRIFFMVRNQSVGWRPFYQRLQKRLTAYCREPLFFVFLPEPSHETIDNPIQDEILEHVRFFHEEFETSDIGIAIPLLCFHSSPAILCVLLGPSHAPPHEHLMFLAALSRSLRDEQLRSDLLGPAVLEEKLDELKTRFIEHLRILSTRHLPNTDVESR